jgi:hypothetical protein
MAWRLPGTARGKDLAATVPIGRLADDHQEVADGLDHCLREDGRGVARVCTGGRLDCGKMRGPASYRHGRARANRADNRGRRGRPAAHPADGLALRSVGAKPGLTVGADVDVRDRPGLGRRRCDSMWRTGPGLTSLRASRGSFRVSVRMLGTGPKTGHFGHRLGRSTCGPGWARFSDCSRT